jgi:hypothetical protein
MFKILLIDRCHFTRAGFEAWLNHSGLFPGHYVVTGLNNLFPCQRAHSAMETDAGYR